MFICAGTNENFDFATSIGVGLINSSINLTRICLFNKPEYLIFIGSAGSYGEHNIFDVIESCTGSNIETSFVQNSSYTPLENVISSDGSKNNIINSSNYITTNIELSKKFLELDLKLENMEFFSVLSVAREFNIPVKGVFVITNYCDENAHKTFIKNHEKSKQILVDYIKDRVK